MVKRADLLAEKRTQFAEVRTELAYKRTMSSDLRTSSTMILFGIAFVGFSKARWDFFFISGVVAIALGVLFLASAANGWAKHSKEIKRIKNFFSKQLSQLKGGGLFS